MKKILNFDKDITFPTMIGEITSISLEHSLKFVDSSNVEGSFFVKGTYKMTEASHIEESFDYSIPVEITLAENFALDTCKVEIEDFYYEIVNDDILKCKIDLLISGVEEVTLEEEERELVVEVEEKIEKEDDMQPIVLESNSNIEQELKVEECLRECDGEIEEGKEELPKKEKFEEHITNTEEILKAENIEIIDENMDSIFSAFKDTEETFVSYSVYILRKNDTLEKVYEMYNVTKEDLNSYNDLDNLQIGTKLIIPNIKHE